MKAFIKPYSLFFLVSFTFSQAEIAYVRAGLDTPDLANAAATISLQPISPVAAGSPIVLNVMVGGSAESVSGLFGLSFELVYSDDTYLEFIEPVVAEAGPYTFTRHEPANRILYLAVSRKRGADGQDGSGTVLTVPVRIKENAPPGWQTCFAIRNSSANDSSGAAIPLLNGAPMCVVVAQQGLTVVPNPFTPNGDGSNDLVEFRREGGFPVDWEIVIMDRAGRLIKRLDSGENVWDGRDEQSRTMLPGTYLYVVRSATQVVNRGLLWLIL
jgi:gliding motility-associated-like protein